MRRWDIKPSQAADLDERFSLPFENKKLIIVEQRQSTVLYFVCVYV